MDGGPSRGWVEPHFTSSAPALLGFDESIDAFCRARHGYGSFGPNAHAETCVRANHNILSLYGRDRDGTHRYNTCRNLEWMVCAAKGTLPGQDSRIIRFAYAPNRLEPTTGHQPIGSCTGYHPAGCGRIGYASSDIFYLEACIYSIMCSNHEALFRLRPGEDWQCEMDWEGYQQVRDWVLRRPAPPP